MKIAQLMTLSQFIDLQKLIMLDETKIAKASDINSKNVDAWNTSAIHAFGRINKYNEFLKQPLKKEMFVNGLEKPVWNPVVSDPTGGLYKLYEALFKEYKQAEKEVIFKGNWHWDFQYGLVKDGIIWAQPNYPTSKDTLFSLAEATNGELELQNVEL